MQIRFIALAFLLAAITAPIEAKADYCRDMFNNIADQLDALADKVEPIKSDTELCKFLRSNSVPLYKSIADRISANTSRCTNMAAAVSKSRADYESMVARTNETCAKAGM